MRANSTPAVDSVDHVPVPVRTTSLRPVGELSVAARAAVDTNPAEVIRRWLAGLSPAAVRSYRRSLRSFCKWAMSDADAPPEHALELLVEAGCGPAHNMVVEWRDHLLGTGLASGSVACYVVGITSLVKACRRAGLIAWRLEQVAPKVERRQDRSGPRRDDVERLVEHVDELAAGGDRRAVRDAAIVRLLYTAAMRRAEVVGLQVEHVQLDHADGPGILAKRKGSRERQLVLISDRSAAALRRWLEVRGDGPGPLFVRLDRARGAHAGALSGESVRKLLRTRAAEAGVRATIRPHGLRHSAATQVAGCASLGTLMAVGGWKSLSAAQNYIDRRQEERRRGLAILEL